MKRLNGFTLVVLLLVVPLLSGCFGGKSNQSGYLILEISDPSPLTVARELFLREAQGKVASMLIPLDGSRISLNLPRGTWDLWVWGRDNRGRVVAQGEARGITGGRSHVLNLSLKQIFNARTPPEIFNVRWDYGRLGAEISWNIVGDTYQSDEWQIWRSQDGKRWLKVGTTYGNDLSFVDPSNKTGDYIYGVRFIDQTSGGHGGPLVQGKGPIRQGMEITWEFRHSFPSDLGRVFDLSTSLPPTSAREFSDLVVHFTSPKAFAQRSRLLQEAGLVITEEMPYLQVVLAEPKFASELSLEEWSSYSGPDFFVEPNWVVQTEGFASNLTRNLPDYLQAMRVPQAQAHVNWRGEVRVAVLDTGLIPNGRIKVVPGYNFVGKNQNTMDDHYGAYHGTDVTKVITEVAPQVTIQPIKVLNSQGYGKVYEVAEGILYAAGMGALQNPTPAQIINLSLGQEEQSRVLQDAIEVATMRGVLVVAASGNAQPGKSPLGVMYPAVYPEVIGVGTIVLASNGPRRADYSHYGYGLDFVAPQWVRGGTSFSAPMVTGVVGLMLGQGILPSQVKSILTNTSIDLGVLGWDEHYGHGLVNGEWAVANLQSFDLIIKDRLTGEVVKQEKVPLNKDSGLVRLNPGEYVVEARLNNFFAQETAVMAGDYGQAIHLILQEPF